MPLLMTTEFRRISFFWQAVIEYRFGG